MKKRSYINQKKKNFNVKKHKARYLRKSLRRAAKFSQVLPHSQS